MLLDFFADGIIRAGAEPRISAIFPPARLTIAGLPARALISQILKPFPPLAVVFSGGNERIESHSDNSGRTKSGISFVL